MAIRSLPAGSVNHNQSNTPYKKPMRRILLISDLHCGHVVGLTPPGWQMQPVVGASATKRDKFINVQQECWEWYMSSLKKYGPFDVVIVNGDLIDGSGWRSGGTEQSVIDRLHQCEMAEYCIRQTMGKNTKVYITIGTAYHTGEAEDFETVVANGIGANKIGSHEWIDIEGVVFDVKHHVGSSSVPHGRHTAIARERLWNVLWAERGLQPKAHVTIRSHVHYYDFCGGVDWIGMTTPALQGYGTKYGARRCSGLVDFGFVVFECNKKSYTWQPIIADTKALRASVIKA